MKLGYFKEYSTLCDKEVKVVVTCAGTVQGMWCRRDVKIVHRSADIGVRTYFDWVF